MIMLELCYFVRIRVPWGQGIEIIFLHVQYTIHTVTTETL